MSSPQRKRRRTGDREGTGEKHSSILTDCASSEEMASSASKMRVVLILCGSMNPITNLHLRMFGNWSIHMHADTLARSIERELRFQMQSIKLIIALGCRALLGSLGCNSVTRDRVIRDSTCRELATP